MHMSRIAPRAERRVVGLPGRHSHEGAVCQPTGKMKKPPSSMLKYQRDNWCEILHTVPQCTTIPPSAAAGSPISQQQQNHQIPAGRMAPITSMRTVVAAAAHITILLPQPRYSLRPPLLPPQPLLLPPALLLALLVSLRFPPLRVVRMRRTASLA